MMHSASVLTDKLAAVISVVELFEMNSNDIPIVKKSYEKVKHTEEKPFFNFYTDSNVDPRKLLRKRQIDVLSFRSLKANLRTALDKRDYTR